MFQGIFNKKFLKKHDKNNDIFLQGSPIEQGYIGRRFQIIQSVVEW